VGIITYVVVMVAGGLFMEADVSMVSLFVTAVISLVLGLALEFFAFGGDYSRTEHLEYEDDDYYYYVKAVPKASISTSERQIKKINKRPGRYEENAPAQEENSQGEPVLSDSIVLTENNVDFEKKLEESLRDL
jgi:hypothetical protein